MNVIAFLGSPRKDGNTELLLREALKGIGESGSHVQVFDLNSMNIEPCQNCGGCDDTGECVIDDDMSPVYESIKKADRIILASPIFFVALSAQVKKMIDRCQSLWCEKYILKKPIPPGKFGRKGLLLLIGGMEMDKGVQCSEACAKAFFRSISVPEHRTLSFLGIDKKGEILGHPTALADAHNEGKKLVE